MKKSKKIVTGLICAVMVFSSILPIYAVEERVYVAHCTQCDDGALYSHEIGRTWTGKTIFKPCRHDKLGFDKYTVYEVTNELRCNKCSYKESSSEEVELFVSCDGVEQ